MKKVRVRRLFAGAAALVIALAPVAAIQLESGIAGATTTADTITYAQALTSSSFNFVPGSGAATTTEAIAPSGSCKTPTTSAAPLLSLSALVYGSPVGGVPYTGTPTSVPVGTSLGHTGVCSSTHGSEPYLITEGQSLTFAPGPNALSFHTDVRRGQGPPRHHLDDRHEHERPGQPRRRRFAVHHRHADRPQRLERRWHQVRRDQR